MSTTTKKVTEYYPRFRLGQRIEHLILMVSFTALAVTGLPQKFASYPFSQNLIDLMGGIETVRIFHRWMAFLLVIGSFYHLFSSAYRFYVRRERMDILPDLKDATDLRDTVAYNLGLKDEHPKMRRFNFGEKFEYWAVVWGTAVMVITGFMLWNPIATTAVLPGEIIPAAKVAHGGEAVLAVLAIIVWHFYNVHLKNFNPSMFTGWLPKKQMEEEHALELERLEEGGEPWPSIDTPGAQRRLRIYAAVAGIAAVVILAVLIWAFTFEETAIITLPPTPEIFVPLNPAP
jgi:formate dehydrogenase gamma subunit